MNDEDLARQIREAVSNLNDAMARAARQHLAVKLHATSHQTTNGVEQVVVEVRIFKQL